MAESYEFFILIASFISSGVIAVTLIVFLISYNQSRKISQADLILKIYDRLNERDELKTLRNLIVQGSPILEINGGPIKEVDLVNYFSLFSNLYRFVKMNIVDKKLAREVFGQMIVSLNSNSEVSEYIKKIQEQQGPEVWVAISMLIDDLKLKKQLKEAFDLRASHKSNLKKGSKNTSN